MFGEETLYWIWLARACGVASKNFLRLIERFSDPYDIYSLDEEQIEHIEGIGERLKNSLCNKELEPSYSVIKFCKKNKVDIISYGDKRYPSRLKTLEDPPAVLFCKGRFPNFNDRLCIAVVGTRKMSEYGKQSAYKIAYEMASANAVIVSGMAKGVDGVAAAGAIEASGETVAVLGSGIDVIYPPVHKGLYDKIIKNGAVISEFMPSTPPEKYNFPIRNRIISGLCQGTLIVEGDKRSGALITAKTALMQGREIFALPGNIGEENAEGPNDLIREGAHVALCADDIIKHYDFLYHDAINYRGLNRAKRTSDIDVSVFLRFGMRDELYLGTSTKVDIKKETVVSVKKEEKVSLSEPQAKGSEQNSDLLAGLDENTRRIFEEMPINSAVCPDALIQNGMSVPDVITALTMLELCGLVSSLPGGLYIRK